MNTRAIWKVASLSVVSAYPGLTALTSVTHGPFGWLAVGVPGPVVLTSADGRTWHRVGGGIEKDLGGVSAVATAAGPADAVITALTADSGGFTAAGQYGQPGQQTVVRWTSAAGTAWTQTQVSALGGGSDAITALASSGSAVTAIGSTATMASRRFLLLARPPG